MKFSESVASALTELASQVNIKDTLTTPSARVRKYEILEPLVEAISLLEDSWEIEEADSGEEYVAAGAIYMATVIYDLLIGLSSADDLIVPAALDFISYLIVEIADAYCTNEEYGWVSEDVQFSEAEEPLAEEEVAAFSDLVGRFYN